MRALCVILFLAACPVVAFAEGVTGAAQATSAHVEVAGQLAAEPQWQYVFDNGVLFMCAILVLAMQAGFALVECGLNCSKNAINILFKNLMDMGIGVLLFFSVGFAIMYPGKYVSEVSSPLINFVGVGLFAPTPGLRFSPSTDWLFQAAFAATAATIVSGAVAGRMKFKSYLIFSALMTGLIYPISGFWTWGGGWLTQLGTETADGYSLAFKDFAGSGIVHAVGGFAGLAGALVLGPRIGRFAKASSKPMPGHNLTFATLGVFILWLGWYGFNPGSQLAFSTASDMDALGTIAMNTTLAAAAGMVMMTFASWILFGKPDLSLAMNGLLGGLVGITACCDCMNPWYSMLVGAVAGMLVLLGIMALDKLEIDDPVGAFPVHGLCGVWGCVATGLIPNAHLAAGETTLFVQLLGISALITWSFGTMFILFFALRRIGWLRVSAAEELAGLDMMEHGMHAYAMDMPFGPETSKNLETQPHSAPVPLRVASPSLELATYNEG